MPSSPPRKWLMDRITGQSKYNERERPPGPCCWVSPCVGWCPGLLETNWCCTCFGKIGLCAAGNESFRFCCLHLGFLFNIAGMLLTAYAALSISLQYFLLSQASMQVLEMNDGTNTVTLYTGLQGVAVDDPALLLSSSPKFIVGYDQFCEFSDSGFGELLLDPTKDCGGCARNYFSMNAVLSILVSVATCFPAIFSTQLRMYSGYDANCVKNFTSLLGLAAILLNLNVMLTYFYLCSKESFYDDAIIETFDANGASNGKITYEWKWGVGLIVLIAGTGCKVLDLLCNCAVATPSVTRDEKEQEIYETIVFASPPDDSTDVEA